MSCLYRFVLSFAAGMLPAAVAVAADYDPPIFVDEAPEMVPVEIGNGWYLRGDVGYNFDSEFANYDFTSVPGLSYSENSSTIFGGIGAGYHFTNYFRADANIGFLTSQNLDVTFADGIGNSSSTSMSSDLWSGMVNGYVDLGTYVGLTPYVGAGAGLVYARNKTSGEIIYPDGSGFADQSTDNQFSFAYSLNAGASYALGPNTSIDVGYQYFSAPNAKYLSADNPKVEGEGVNLHQIKVGLRYDLW